MNSKFRIRLIDELYDWSGLDPTIARARERRKKEMAEKRAEKEKEYQKLYSVRGRKNESKSATSMDKA